jgi:hypothetical protein
MEGATPSNTEPLVRFTNAGGSRSTSLTGGGRREARAGGGQGFGTVGWASAACHRWARRKGAFAHPTDRSPPLRLYDLEHARKFIHQHHQLTEPHQLPVI